MSAATIDRYLAPAGARAVRGRSTAKGRSRLAQLHQDPQGRRARWRPSPGSSRPVTVAHCGPVLEAGSSPGPLSTTRCAHGADLHPLDPRASPTRRIISAPGAAVDAIPFPVLGMDFDNGSEFTGHGVVRWAGNPGHLLPPARAPTGKPTSSTSPRSPASCPTSARASGSGEPPRPPPITRAVPREAPKKFRGHLDMRHPGSRRDSSELFHQRTTNATSGREGIAKVSTTPFTSPSIGQRRRQDRR